MEPSTGEVTVPKDVLYAYPNLNAVSPLKNSHIFQPATSKGEAMERYPPLSIVIRSEQNRTEPIPKSHVCRTGAKESLFSKLRWQWLLGINQRT